MASIHVQGDSQSVIGWLQGRHQLQAVDLLFWKERIKFLKDHFQYISFQHVDREFNCRVDASSKRGLLEEEGVIIVEKFLDNHLQWRGRFLVPSSHQLLPL